MSNLTPIKSFEEYSTFANSHGYSPYTNLFLGDLRSPIGRGQYVLDYYRPLPKDLPTEDVTDFRTSEGNEANFWVLREALRFIDGPYLQCAPIARALRNQPDEIRDRHFYHMLHTSIEDQTMVAYTPDHKYGLADRQVKMKIGRYLQKFYADAFTQEQIRDIANNVQGGKVKWAYGSEDIRRVYENGPHSCMVSCGTHNGVHPVEVYGYQFEDDSYQLGLAYLEDVSGGITARCLCDLKSKTYTRFYGDDGCILGSKLDEMGYEKVYSMDCYGIRLKHVGEYRSKPIMAYLDGNGKNVELKYDSVRQEQYWVWTENGSYCADEPDGLLDEEEEEEEEEEETYYCECCDCHVSEGDYSYSDYHDIRICDDCAGDTYVYAYYGRYGNQTYVHQDDVICVRDDYYADDSATRSRHDIIEREDGEHDFKRYCVELHDERWVQEGHDELVCLHDGSYALMDDSDVVCLIDGEYGLDSDDDVVCLENDGGYALKDDDGVVEVKGLWYMKCDAEVIQDKDGDWVLAEDLEDEEEETKTALHVAAIELKEIIEGVSA